MNGIGRCTAIMGIVADVEVYLFYLAGQYYSEHSNPAAPRAPVALLLREHKKHPLTLLGLNFNLFLDSFCRAIHVVVLRMGSSKLLMVVINVLRHCMLLRVP